MKKLLQNIRLDQAGNIFGDFFDSEDISDELKEVVLDLMIL